MFVSPQRLGVFSVLLGLLLFPPAVRGTGLEASVSADRVVVQPGQKVLLTVRVRGAEGMPEVQAPSVPDAVLKPLGQGKAVSPSLGSLPTQNNPAFQQAVQALNNMNQDVQKSLKGLSDPALDEAVPGRAEVHLGGRSGGVHFPVSVAIPARGRWSCPPSP